MAVNHVATEATDLVHDLAGAARRLILRLLYGSNAHGRWLSEGAIGLGEQCRRDLVDLRRRELELRHLQRRAEGARVTDLGSDVVVQRVLDVGREGQLVERLAPN